MIFPDANTGYELCPESSTSLSLTNRHNTAATQDKARNFNSEFFFDLSESQVAQACRSNFDTMP